jgi:hypothetical protein
MSYAVKVTLENKVAKYVSYKGNQTIFEADLIDNPLDAKTWHGKRWASKAAIAIRSLRTDLKSTEVVEVYP